MTECHFSDPDQVLADLWPAVALDVISIEPVGGGLSNGLVFHVRTATANYRLDALEAAWPEEKCRSADSIFSAAEAGLFSKVAVRVPARNGESFRQLHMYKHWQLQEWLPGAIVPHSDWTNLHSRLAAAQLAEFHEVMPRVRNAPSSALRRRHDLLAALRQRESHLGWNDLLGKPVPLPALNSTVHLPLADTFSRAANQASRLVEELVDRPVGQQLCWGDAWRGNILFDGGQVSGLIDFATATVDSPMLDLARLTGSLPGSLNDREAGFDEYARWRPLAENDRLLARAFDLSGVVLSLVNWLRWIDSDHTATRNPQAGERLTHLAERVRSFADEPH